MSTSKSEMARYRRQMFLRSKISAQIENVFNNTIRFYWSKWDLIEGLKAIWDSEEYGKLRECDKDYLRGQQDLHRRNLDKLTAPAYYIGGEFLLITDDRYRKISPQVVCEKHKDHLAYVWKDSPQKVFFGYREDTNRNVTVKEKTLATINPSEGTNA